MRAAPIVLAVAVGTVSGGPVGIARQSSDTGSLVVVVRERGSGRPSLTGVVGAMRINPYRQKGWVLAAVRLEDGSDVLARMIDFDPGATAREDSCDDRMSPRG